MASQRVNSGPAGCRDPQVCCHATGEGDRKPETETETTGEQCPNAGETETAGKPLQIS